MRHGTLRSRASSVLHWAESLESRVLLSGLNQNVGLLAGRFYIQRTVLGSDTDVFTFTVPGTAGVSTGGGVTLSTFDKIDVQLSRPRSATRC